jgi:cytosine/creatinine deaminase
MTGGVLADLAIAVRCCSCRGQDAAKRAGPRPERAQRGGGRNVLPEPAILPEGPAGGHLRRGRAGNLIEACVACGTAHLRTHVDIDLESCPLKLDGTLAAPERHRGRVSVQIVAFPQGGVMRCSGILELLDAAVRSGADLVGGIDPLEIDRDPKGQLDGIFAIAARHGVGLDIHLHEPGEMGLFNVQEICARTRALGLGGRVTISHGFCLGDITEKKAAAAAKAMAEAGVALVTHGAGGLTPPPLARISHTGLVFGRW